MPLVVAAALLLSIASSAIPDRDPDGKPHLRSESVIVRLADTGEVVLRKNAEVVRPIASVTKLLSGLLLSTADVARDQLVTIGEEDKDRLKWSRSQLKVSLTTPWLALAKAAIGASDNRAMYAAVRTAMERGRFVALMNDKARQLGMRDSRFVDPAGVDPGNVSTARDLLHLLDAAAADAEVRAWSLEPTIELPTDRGAMLLRNPDRLVHLKSWDVVVGKTGYTVEAGRTLIVRVTLAGRPVDMVFLGSREMASVFGDAGRVKRWLLPQLGAASAGVQ